MARVILFTIVASIVPAVFGEPSSSPTAIPDGIARLRWLDQADVKADFHRVVVEQHDTRFLAVGTLGRRIPAGPYDPDDLVTKHGFRDLAIGCVISDGEELRLRKKADDYADEYNQMLVRYLRSRQ